jgi:hypothetical protein
MPLVQYVQRQKVNALSVSNFVEAQNLQDIARRLVQAITAASARDYSQARIETLESKLQNLVGRLDDFHRETRARVRDRQAEHSERRSQLVSHHNGELGLFEEKWNSQDYLIRFAKPSPYLLQVKKIERSLVLAKNFEKAEEYRRQAAALERAESGTAQQRAERAMQVQHRQLIQKQLGELRAFDEWARRDLIMLQHTRQLELVALTARQVSLRNEIEMRKNSKVVPPTVAPSKGADDGAVMTPRTIQRFSEYKTCIKQPKIIVKPLGTIGRKLGARRKPSTLLAD